MFFLKPGSDLYDDQETNVEEEYSDWHKQSVNGIKTEIVPVLTEYFLTEKISREEKGHAAWITDGIFEFVPSRKEISSEYAARLTTLVKASLGYNAYIDKCLQEKLIKL